MHLNRKKINNKKKYERKKQINNINNETKNTQKSIPLKKIKESSINTILPSNTQSYLDKLVNNSVYNDISEKTKERIKNEKICVSIVGPSIRPEYWIYLYNNIKKYNITPFEIIFCGDAKFDFKLPSNFTYIYSKVKPVQCWEIARRSAWGNFVFLATDDIFFNKYCIDNLVETYLNKATNLYDIISTQYYSRYMSKDKNNKFSVVQLFWPKVWLKNNNKIIFDMPYFPVNIFAKTEALDNIGGIDNRFIAEAFDQDLSMRMYEKGGKLYYSNYSFIIKEYRSETSLDKQNNYSWSSERKNIFDLWCKKYNGKEIDISLFYGSIYKNMIISRKRLDKVRSFYNENILYKSQGSIGKWE